MFLVKGTCHNCLSLRRTVRGRRGGKNAGWRRGLCIIFTMQKNLFRRVLLRGLMLHHNSWNAGSNHLYIFNDAFASLLFFFFFFLLKNCVFRFLPVMKNPEVKSFIVTQIFAVIRIPRRHFSCDEALLFFIHTLITWSRGHKAYSNIWAIWNWRLFSTLCQLWHFVIKHLRWLQCWQTVLKLWREQSIDLSRKRKSQETLK